MGQRLNIQFEDNTGVLANAYYHWSGYTSSAMLLTNKIISSDLIDDTSISNKVKAVKLLELTGAGLTIYEFNDDFPSHLYKESKDRNEGLIAISKEGIEETQSWEEARVTINLDTNKINFRTYWESDHDDYDPEDIAKQTYVTYDSELNYEDVSFEKFPELYKEFELNYSKGNYIVNTPESKLHFIA
jgi:hypothetical protein